MRFHLIDRIETIKYNEYITGVKCITLADDVFNEHFPGKPVFPGSLIIEGLAQLGGLLLELSLKHTGPETKYGILSIVNKMKFRKLVQPGDKLHYRAEIDSFNEDFGVVKVSAKIDGEELCTEGKLTFTLHKITDTGLLDSRAELYKLTTKDMRVIE